MLVMRQSRGPRVASSSMAKLRRTEPSRSSAKATVQRLFRSSAIRNKLKRHEVFQREKAQRTKEKRERREQRKREREMLGDEAPPKEVPRTIENTRIPDETIVFPDDEEVLQDQKTDELSSYFDRKTTPKVLILSIRKAGSKSHLLMRELVTCIPNSEMYQRKRCNLKKLIPQAIERDFTDMIVINEDVKVPNGLLLIHLPDGPTAHFKLTNFKRGYDIKRHGRPTSHHPEVILNNFTTRLGHTVARMFATLFPHDPEFKGRRVVTFHNQRDYIFFRHHRYIFRNGQKASIQELGPRFTLKLRSLQKGTFDSKYGKYVWIHKRRQMDTSRRIFHL